MKQVTGACLYCGQTQMIEVADDCNDPEVYDRAATANCKCDEALRVNAEHQVSETFKQNVESTFIENHQEVQDIFKFAAEHLASGKSAKLTIKIPDKRFKFEAVRKANGDIKLVVETKDKEEIDT